MSGAGKAGIRRERTGETTTLGMDPLNVAIRNMQLAHAVATVAERAATHGMVEAHCLADVFLVVVSLIERGLDAERQRRTLALVADETRAAVNPLSCAGVRINASPVANLL